MNRKSVGTVGAAILATLLVVFLLLLVLMYTGVYNVSATSGHTAVGRWALKTVMRNSVAARADAQAPREFSQAMVAAGAGEYKSMCQHCHGGPGVSRAAWAQGIVPSPPPLSRAAAEWRAEEIYWIVKHGIKMSAMPAFGSTHDNQTIWNITAFVEQLPDMAPQTYAAFPAGHGGSSEGSDNEGSGGHSHSAKSAR